MLRSLVWPSKLHTIERIESFGAEFDLEALSDFRSLEESEIKIIDAVATQARVCPAGVAECVTRGDCKATGVEPPAEPLLRGAIQFGIATAGDVRPKSGVEARDIGRGGKLQRETVLKRAGAIDAPAGNQLIHNALGITHEPLSFAERQIVDIGEGQSAARVVA